jgi:gamma-glutamyltranspeptidase/glutathione hydrolase
MGTNGMVAATHYLASQAGFHCLKQGGNAVDAGATMWFCLTILEPHLVGVAGESPILLYSADEEKVIAVNGQGPSPKLATIEWFQNQSYDMIPPDGFLPAVVPAAFDAWIRTLDNYGTMTLENVMNPAIDLAAKGFPMYPEMRRSLTEPNQQVGVAAGDSKAKLRQRSVAERFLEEWPSSAEIFLADGKVPEIGSLTRNVDLAKTFQKIAKTERSARKGGRKAGLEAARNCFYTGWIAEQIVKFMQTFKCRDVYEKDNNGLMTLEDFECYQGRFEDSVSVNYRGYDVHKCGVWTQGPVFLQQLNLLEGFDLQKMGHNTVEYLHTLIECAKLAFADREQYYADPDFVEVPLQKLLSKEYAERRRSLVDPEHASLASRPGQLDAAGASTDMEGMFQGDTVHLEAADKFGNMVCATPSGAWISTSPIIPGLGFCMNTRGQMFHLNSKHVERLEPGKRPSTTLSPSLVLKDQKALLTFGTPGADQQDQWTLQFFLNSVDFGMDLQLSLDRPTVHSTHFAGSFWPHASHPGVMHVEADLSKDVVQGLKDKGHIMVLDEPWSHGRCLAISRNADTGVMCGAASPRGMKAYAIGW